MRNLFLAALLCSVITLESEAKPRLRLADMKNWSIVCSPMAIESEAFAASEFQSLFKELTGLELPIEKIVPEDGGYVVIGPAATASSASHRAAR